MFPGSTPARSELFFYVIISGTKFRSAVWLGFGPLPDRASAQVNALLDKVDRCLTGAREWLAKRETLDYKKKKKLVGVKNYKALDSGGRLCE